jgi:thiol:disulfide interchange protein DsbA
MKNVFFKFLAAISILLVVGCNAQAQGTQTGKYQEGVHYFLIEGVKDVPADSQELVEVFSYLCTHCNTFDPYVESWLKRKPADVAFQRYPAVFGRESWELYARAYVTAQLMNAPDEAHVALMDRIWKEKDMMRNMDQLATFYSQFGLNKEKFLSTSRSFAVDGKLRKDQAMIQAWGIRGTPSLVLNGKYRITGNAAVPSYETMFDVVDYLIALEAPAYQESSAAAD